MEPRVNGTSSGKNAIGPKTILRIIRSYALFGALWVGASDVIVYLHGGETRQDFGLSFLKGMLFICVSALLLYAILRNSLHDTLIERDSYRERLLDLSLYGNDIVLLLDHEGRILEANDRAVASYGYSAEELGRMTLADLVGEPEKLPGRWETLLREGSLRNETWDRRADGTRFRVEFSARRFTVGEAVLVHTVIRDISERHDAERQLRNLKDTYAALFQTNQCIVHCTESNELFQETCEIAANCAHLEVAWIGTVDAASQVVTPVAKAGPAAEYVTGLQVSIDPASPFSKGVAGRALLSGGPVVMNNLWSGDGFQAWSEKLTEHRIQSWAAYPILQGGQPAGVLALYSHDQNFFTHELSALLEEMVTDLSLALDRIALRAREAELQAELDKLKKAVEQSQVTVVIADKTGAIQYVNPAFTATSGYSAEEALGKNPRILKSGEMPSQQYAEMWRLLSEGESWSGEFHNKRKDGSLYWEEAVISPVKDTHGEITHFIAVKQDVTARREAEAKARFLAFHDALTELPNRLIAKAELDKAMHEADLAHERAVLLFVDVDNLKRVNDSLGHNMGDRLLQALAQRLKGCMRDGDLLSRVGGDEFLVVLPRVKNLDTVESVAERIRGSMTAPLDVDGLELTTTVSIGAAVYPDDGQSFDELCRQADLAMYHAKRQGRDAFRTYSRSMETNAHEYVITVNGLRRALEREELVLHYQPQIHLESGEVRGVEALLRWQRPGFGLVPPGKFISIAEDSGLIFEMGNWVIRRVCEQAAAWRDAGVPRMRLAFNLSALQLRRGGLEDVIAGALKVSRLEPEYLELELTESALVHDNVDVKAYLRKLKELGIGIALDDFGTGYSNFNYLRHFDLDRLKIDQSFVRNINPKNGSDIAIVRSIVQLARNFGLETVAEGVETEEALRVVRRAGCDHVQGYLFAKPMPATAIPAFISERKGTMISQDLDTPRANGLRTATIQ